MSMHATVHDLMLDTDAGTSWPPIDPDRLFRFDKIQDSSSALIKSLDPEDFRRRQQADLLRQKNFSSEAGIHRRQPFHLRYADREPQPSRYLDEEEIGLDATEDNKFEYESNHGSVPDSGEEGWRNSEGERLADFGVEEDIEFYDEDDLPLAEILRRRKAQQ